LDALPSTVNNVGTLAFVNGNINAMKYEEILENNLWPVVGIVA